MTTSCQGGGSQFTDAGLDWRDGFWFTMVCLVWLGNEMGQAVSTFNFQFTSA